jgi:RIO-like serine/threonine protein kinase
MDNLETKLKAAVVRNAYLDLKRIIFFLDTGIIAKAYLEEKIASHAYDLGCWLFEQGVQVPEVYKLSKSDNITVHAFTTCKEEQGERNHFLFMQFVKGMDLRQITKEQRKEALKQYQEQIERILDLGIIPHDADWVENVKFDCNENKLYLLDFDHWVSASPYEIGKYKARLPKNFVSFRYYNQVINMRLSIYASR